MDLTDPCRVAVPHGDDSSTCLSDLRFDPFSNLFGGSEPVKGYALGVRTIVVTGSGSGLGAATTGDSPERETG